MTQEQLKKLLHYNPETGIFTWRVSVGAVKSGDVAGTHTNGYIDIKVKGNVHKSHRLSFLYMTGSIPEQVDHINHEKTDNRWQNLRPATSSINQKNASIRHDNKSGHTGVIWHKVAKKWLAQIRVDGKLIYLGIFVDINDAIQVRQEANIKYNFHANHGESK